MNGSEPLRRRQIHDDMKRQGQGGKMRSDNRQSALWMTGSMTAFASGDTLIKLIGESLPVAQIIVLRGILPW